MNARNEHQGSFSILKELLTNQINSIKQATVYLKDIKLSIEKNDLDALKKLIQHNDIPLKQIEEQEKARYLLVEQLGFENNREGLSQCIESFDNKSKDLSVLHKLLNQAMDELQTATKVSDLLVTKNKIRVKQSLSILTGASLQKDPTYSSSGSKSQDKLIRPLAIA